MYLGIEIGGTKLQLGIGSGNGTLTAFWRGTVDVSRGAVGIREQILQAFPGLLEKACCLREQIQAAGIGFGGPVDDANHTVIKSHQIQGWDGFPLANWLGEMLELPIALGNDADLAGLAEAHYGAGRGVSPLFYITIGSGIGGGLILDGKIFRGAGRGAAEIGHLRVRHGNSMVPLEKVASGWGIAEQTQNRLHRGEGVGSLLQIPRDHLDVASIAQAARAGDSFAQDCLERGQEYLAEGISQVIALLCPRRIVLGGGVSLLPDSEFLQPIREKVAEKTFAPFKNLTEIVKAELGEEMVIHGAIAWAKQMITS